MREVNHFNSRKRKSEFQENGSSSLNSSLVINCRESSNESRRSQYNKKNENDLYLYESAKGTRTPGFGSESKRMKDSISMQKILQPYIALDLINITKDGFVANDKVGSFSTRSN